MKDAVVNVLICNCILLVFYVSHTRSYDAQTDSVLCANFKQLQKCFTNSLTSVI